MSNLLYIYHNSRLLKAVKLEQSRGSSESSNDKTGKDETESDDDAGHT